MTIIVAYRDDARGEVWIGADSRGTNSDGFIYAQERRKITRCGPWVIGAGGSAYNSRWIAEEREAIATLSSVAAVSDFLRSEFEKFGYKHGDHSGPTWYEGQELIVASKDDVVEIIGEGSIFRPDDGFVAIGSGADFAYGAAHAVMSVAHGEISGDLICRLAIEAACKYDAYCGGKIVVEKV